VKVAFRQAANDDLVRQFRYYLVTLNPPDVAIRFRAAVRETVQFLQRSPLVGPRYRSGNPHLQSLRTWAVTGFEAIRIYYLLDNDTLQVIRILHGKRDVNRLLEREGGI